VLLNEIVEFYLNCSIITLYFGNIVVLTSIFNWRYDLIAVLKFLIVVLTFLIAVLPILIADIGFLFAHIEFYLQF